MLRWAFFQPVSTHFFANSSVQWVAFLLGLLGFGYIFNSLYNVALVTMMWVTYLLFARWYVLP